MTKLEREQNMILDLFDVPVWRVGRLFMATALLAALEFE
jgi:hypothetical protein